MHGRAAWPPRFDVPEGLSERWGWYRPPMAAPGRPQVRLAATSAAGRGLHELHLRKVYAFKTVGLSTAWFKRPVCTAVQPGRPNLI